MSRGYSFDLRERAIALVEGGMSRRAAARQLMISPSSSVKWFQRFAATGSFAEKYGATIRMRRRIAAAKNVPERLVVAST